jgi:hypothetical protein
MRHPRGPGHIAAARNVPGEGEGEVGGILRRRGAWPRSMKSHREGTGLPWEESRGHSPNGPDTREVSAPPRSPTQRASDSAAQDAAPAERPER